MNYFYIESKSTKEKQIFFSLGEGGGGVCVWGGGGGVTRVREFYLQRILFNKFFWGEGGGGMGRGWAS